MKPYKDKEIEDLEKQDQDNDIGKLRFLFFNTVAKSEFFYFSKPLKRGVVTHSEARANVEKMYAPGNATVQWRGSLENRKCTLHDLERIMMRKALAVRSKVFVNLNNVSLRLDNEWQRKRLEQKGVSLIPLRKINLSTISSAISMAIEYFIQENHSNVEMLNFSLKIKSFSVPAMFNIAFDIDIEYSNEFICAVMSYLLDTLPSFQGMHNIGIGLDPNRSIYYLLKLCQVLGNLTLGELALSLIQNLNQYVKYQTRNIIEFRSTSKDFSTSESESVIVSRDSLLFKAILLDWIELVEEIISEDIIEYSNFLKQTPLHAAALVGNVRILKLLARYNVKIDPVDYKGRTPLVYAVSHSSPNHFDCAKCLIKYGAVVQHRDGNGFSVLDYAVAFCNNPELIDYLIDRGAKYTHKAVYEFSTLYVMYQYFIYKENIDIYHLRPMLIALLRVAPCDPTYKLLEDLIENLIKLNRESELYIILHSCLQESDPYKAIDYFISKGFKIDSLDTEDDNLIHIIIKCCLPPPLIEKILNYIGSDSELLKKLLNHINKMGDSPISLAIGSGDIGYWNVVVKWIEHIDLSYKRPNVLESYFHQAVKAKQLSILQALVKSYEQSNVGMKWLLDITIGGSTVIDYCLEFGLDSFLGELSLGEEKERVLENYKDRVETSLNKMQSVLASIVNHGVLSQRKLSELNLSYTPSNDGHQSLRDVVYINVVKSELYVDEILEPQANGIYPIITERFSEFITLLTQSPNIEHLDADIKQEWERCFGNNWPTAYINLESTYMMSEAAKLELFRRLRNMMLILVPINNLRTYSGNNQFDHSGENEISGGILSNCIDVILLPFFMAYYLETLKFSQYVHLVHDGKLPELKNGLINIIFFNFEKGNMLWQRSNTTKQCEVDLPKPNIKPFLFQYFKARGPFISHAVRVDSDVISAKQQP